MCHKIEEWVFNAVVNVKTEQATSYPFLRRVIIYVHDVVTPTQNNHLARLIWSKDLQLLVRQEQVLYRYFCVYWSTQAYSSSDTIIMVRYWPVRTCNNSFDPPILVGYYTFKWRQSVLQVRYFSVIWSCVLLHTIFMADDCAATIFGNIARLFSREAWQRTN